MAQTRVDGFNHAQTIVGSILTTNIGVTCAIEPLKPRSFSADKSTWRPWSKAFQVSCVVLPLLSGCKEWHRREGAKDTSGGLSAPASREKRCYDELPNVQITPESFETQKPWWKFQKEPPSTTQEWLAWCWSANGDTTSHPNPFSARKSKIKSPKLSALELPSGGDNTALGRIHLSSARAFQCLPRSLTRKPRRWDVALRRAARVGDGLRDQFGSRRPQKIPVHSHYSSHYRASLGD